MHISSFGCAMCLQSKFIHINVSLFVPNANVLSRPLVWWLVARVCSCIISVCQLRRFDPIALVGYLSSIHFSLSSFLIIPNTWHLYFMYAAAAAYLLRTMHNAEPAQLFCCNILFLHSTVAHCYWFYNYVLREHWKMYESTYHLPPAHPLIILIMWTTITINYTRRPTPFFIESFVRLSCLRGISTSNMLQDDSTKVVFNYERGLYTHILMENPE